LYDAAPDLTSLTIEGFEAKPTSGFVALDKLMGGTAGLPVTLGPQDAD
jgi:hypothetical protein